MFRRFKGSFYALFFVLINVVYLIIELSFNARLLDASAQMLPTTDFGQLELYGRTISAAGATILAWRVFVPFDESLKLFRMAMRFMLVALICFPLVFMGQKKLIDTLVDESSNEARRTAQILSLLKYGIANGFVELDTLATNELTMQTAEGKMFVTLSGLLVYSADSIRNTLEFQLEKIARFAIDTQKNTDSEQAYQNYLYARNLILNDYRQYLDLQVKFENSMQLSTQKSIQIYEQAMNVGLHNWLNLKQIVANHSHKKVSIAMLLQIKSLLFQMEQRLNFCRDERCVNQQKNQHLMKINKIMASENELEFWCEKNSSNSLTKPKHSCPNELKLLESKITELSQRKFANQAGLSDYYRTQDGYLRSEEFRKQVIDALEKNNITLKPDYDFSNFPKLIKSIRQQLQKENRAQLELAMKAQFNSPLAPRLGIESFSQLSEYQNVFRQALGPIYRSPMTVELSKMEFAEKYMQPLYFLKYDSLINKLQAEDKWYAQGAPYEASGKSGLRNLVIPPVAIAFSLIFGLLNLISLILNLVFYLIQETRANRWIGFVILTALVVIMPLQQHHQIVNQQAYISLLQHTENRFGLGASSFILWISKTEPMVYPLGNIMRINLLEGFSFD